MLFRSAGISAEHHISQYSPEVTDIIGDMLQNVMFGGYTGADAVALAEQQIEALD